MNTKIFSTLIGLSALVLPLQSIAQEAHEQKFVITAYYSPLPDQCCYVKGSVKEDRILNGDGTHGADGTPVYPGMIAAPPSYAFGTRVALPGLGTFTVHDRSGAIQEGDDAHRLDIWMGSGEEGLARALAFGVQEVTGTVYPPDVLQPAEAVALDLFPAPDAMLAGLLATNDGLIDVRPNLGEKGYSVRLLQEALTKTGFFTHAVTGYFGDVTEHALSLFVANMRLKEPSNKLTDRTAAFLLASLNVPKAMRELPIVDATSTQSEMSTAQRILRGLGYYHGRTDGVYSDALKQAIIAFQKSESIITSDATPGAGRVGPQTRARLTELLTLRRVERQAEKYLSLMRIRTLLTERATLVTGLLQPGEQGEHVVTLQKRLASLGFFSTENINGVYGPLTQKSVTDYQLARGIVEKATEAGAGIVGFSTLRALQDEHIESIYRLVRTVGWGAM